MQSKAQNSYVERLLKNDSESLYEMKRMIDGLLDHPGWAFVMELVDARIADAQLQMETGLHHQAEYTGYIGEIRGMRVARAAAEAVLRASEIREEQDRQLVAQMAAGEDHHG